MRKIKENDSVDYANFLTNDKFIYWRLYPSKELDDYWKSFIEKNTHWKDDFSKAIKEFERIRLSGEIMNDDDEKISKQIALIVQRRKFIPRNWFNYASTVAAGLIILLISSLYLINYTFNGEKHAQEIIIGNKMADSDITLNLGNEQIHLNNNSQLDFSQNRDEVFVKDSIGEKVINLRKQQINKLFVPYGKRSSVILADGSKVWINSGTEIEFPTEFLADKRSLKVNGEIFIKVRKNKVPFEINTLNSQILVHGTSFNVNAFENEQKEYIVLVEGAVEVKSSSQTLNLVPNRMAEVENGKIRSKVVDVLDYTSWKEGYLSFDKTPLSEVLLKIGKYYNIEFRVSKNLKLQNRSCSGKLYLFEDVNDVMKAFSNLTNLTVEKQGDNTYHVK